MASSKMASKRRQPEPGPEERQTKRGSIAESNPGTTREQSQTPWLDEQPAQNWRTLGTRAVQPSLPLSNMVSAVQDLIDPDFDPLTAFLDVEPQFLKPLPAKIAAEDLEFLRFRGALSIPPVALRNELLRCYIQWVHSFMPVLNLQEFLRCVAENDPSGNVSMLLFQAVMFVATAFIDLKHLNDAGYATRKDARNAFYTRLRLLYSLDCEEDRIVILQTVLLMTYWSDQENSPQRDIWDWIGVCNTQAHSIGLNRDPSTADMDPTMKRLRSRLWWSLYTRDRLIALGLRRPTQINEGACSVPMLRLEDFDLEPFAPSVREMLHCRQLEDVSQSKRLATMFIEMVKLCQWIGRVLFAQYTPSQRHFGTTTQTTITLIPRQATESELARCSQRLDAWVNGLPKDAQFIPASTSFKDGEEVLLLHSAMLKMLYHATNSALYRPWAITPRPNQPKSSRELMQTARRKIHDTVAGITHVIQGLGKLNLTRFLPQSGVTVILPAAVAHLTTATTTENSAVRESSIANFNRCVQALQRLSDIYPAADMEVANIEAAVRMQAREPGSGSGNGNASGLLRVLQHTMANPNSTHPQPQAPSSTANENRPPPNIPSPRGRHPITQPPYNTFTPPPTTEPQPGQLTHQDPSLHPDTNTTNMDLDITTFLDFPTDPYTFDQGSSPGMNLDLNPNLDWAEGLIRDPDEMDLYADAGVFSPTAGRTGSMSGGTGITGDLDRDLGFS